MGLHRNLVTWGLGWIVFYKNTASEALSTRVSGSSGDQINRKEKKVCAASRHNLSKSVGVEEASRSPWEHADYPKIILAI